MRGGTRTRQKQQQQQEYLTEGSTVEVTSDEEGFEGVWFDGTILNYSLNKKKVLVEYRSILADDNGSKPLRELVHVSFVRPVPPLEIVECFGLHDVVDASYKDGWWTGVITKVLDDSRYQVTFNNPPDVLEFCVSDLRLHKQWVNGNWVLPGKQRTDSLMFSVGKNVEVLFDRDDRRDAWFPSKVLEQLENGSFLVERYRTIDKKASIDKVTVDSFHIRPLPPHIKRKKFNLLEKVDAFYDLAWWSGVITRELADSRYIVFFKHTNMQKELNDFDLRPHMDWKDGQWFTTSRDIPIPPDCQTNGSNNCTDTSILKKDTPLGRSSIMNEISEEKTPQSIKLMEDLNEPHSTDEISPEETLQNALPNCDAASPQTPEPPKDMSLEACTLRSKPSKKPRTKSPFSQSSPKSEYAEMKISAPLAGDEQTHNRSWQNRTRKRCQELGVKKSGALEKLRGLKSPSRGLECTKVRSSKAKRSRLINNESLESIGDLKQIDAAIDDVQDTKHSGDGGGSSQKRRRGRPARKLPSIIPAVMEPIGDHRNDENSGHVELAIMENEVGKEQLEVQMGHSRKRGRTKKISQTKMSNEKAVRSLSQQHEKHYVKREKRQQKSVNIESQVQASVDSSGVKPAESNRATDGEEVLAEIPFNGFDDQPLAKWFEEIQAPTSIDGLRVSPACSPKRCAEMREKQDMPMQTPANRTPATQIETQSLPFVKNTLLWSTIEAMDIFRRIPQKPHFTPLEQSKESSREGQAIGYMVTFLSIVERTSRLQFDDPRSTFEEIMETLTDLETHGFNVQAVRDRLSELLLMKDKQEKLESQVAGIDNQIITHNMDKERIDGEIKEINKQIAELQDKLSLATSRKEAKDREIDGLRSRLMGIQAGTMKAHTEFDSLASKPL
ncbi:DUF724 domain-containing protein 6 isoform X2 [Solanum lycopersicum]|uniref:DUF724 domain-containing protein 6 isoform X2 n=1 Tax=Solanum lycopersicum TaxID=4081 RepID=UPI000532AB8A|nr:DUF724 domain-containing protein 10 isoform X2 [Solanum lycopersicum]